MNIVVSSPRRQKEGRLRIVQFTGDGLHLSFRQSVGVRDHAGGISRERAVSERVDLVEAATVMHGHAPSGKKKVLCK
jgi:hypothetical protein